MSSSYEELKLFEYVARFSKEDLYIVCDQKEYTFNKVEKVVISPSLYIGDSCESCGMCCGNYMINFTEEWIERFNESQDSDFLQYNLNPNIKKEIMQNLKLKKITVNDKNVNWYYLPKVKQQGPRARSCHYIIERDNKWYCKMHPVKSITCILPHIVVRQNNNVTYLRKQMYARNHLMKCPVIFNKFDYNKFIGNDIPALQILKNVSYDMGVNTYLDDIIEYILSKKDELKRGIIPNEQKIFYKSKKGFFV